MLFSVAAGCSLLAYGTERKNDPGGEKARKEALLIAARIDSPEAQRYFSWNTGMIPPPDEEMVKTQPRSQISSQRGSSPRDRRLRYQSS